MAAVFLFSLKNPFMCLARIQEPLASASLQWRLLSSTPLAPSSYPSRKPHSTGLLLAQLVTSFLLTTASFIPPSSPLFR